MARTASDEEEEWDEGPEVDEDDDGTDPCPHCGKPIYIDGEWCPKCGKYLTEEEPVETKWRRVWVMVITVLALVAMLIAGFR